MKRATFFVLLIAICITSSAQNLVVNPGFETWTNISRPTGWNHAENCLKDSSSAVSGDYTCKHGGDVSTTSDLGQSIPVVAGKEYRLSLYNRTIVTSSGKGSRIWCYWKDSENSSIDDPLTNEIMRPSQYFTNETWQQYSIIVTAPPNAANFYLEVRTNTNSVAYWDDFVFEESFPTSSYERYESPVIIYPNPASTYLIIKNLHNLQHIGIHSLAGNIIWSMKFHGEEMVTIFLAKIPDGIYIVRIHTGSEIITRKFIKE